MGMEMRRFYPDGTPLGSDLEKNLHLKRRMGKGMRRSFPDGDESEEPFPVEKFSAAIIAWKQALGHDDTRLVYIQN
jgi:hypothetical protein